MQGLLSRLSKANMFMSRYGCRIGQMEVVQLHGFVSVAYTYRNQTWRGDDRTQRIRYESSSWLEDVYSTAGSSRMSLTMSVIAVVVKNKAATKL